MNVRRLKRLAIHLISGKLGHDIFDVTEINRKNSNEMWDYRGCGTIGGIVGELPICFPESFKFIKVSRGIKQSTNSTIVGRCDSIIDDFHYNDMVAQVSNFFGLRLHYIWCNHKFTDHQPFKELFVPNTQCGLYKDYIWLTDNHTADKVGKYYLKHIKLKNEVYRQMANYRFRNGISTKKRK